MKNKILTFFLLVATVSFSIFAKEKEYEYWGDDYFENPDSITVRQERVSQISAGFFPKPYANIRSFWVTETIGWNHSKGSVKIDEQFPSHSAVFTAQPPKNKSELKKQLTEKQPFSDKNKYGLFKKSPPDKNANIGFSFEIPVPNFHTILSPKIGYSNRYIFSFSPIETNYFLGYIGEQKSSFEEISVLEFNDKKLYTSLDFKHPIYGAFMKSSDQNISSFWFLTYGVGAEFSIDCKLTVNEFIISEGHNIRYSNGEIKTASLHKENYLGIKKIRPNYNFGIGWQFGADFANTSIELKYRGSFDSIFEKNDFKQNTLFFGLNVDMAFMFELVKIFIPGI